jgi:N-acetylmuramoyl-L-alanine amidase
LPVRAVAKSQIKAQIAQLIQQGKAAVGTSIDSLLVDERSQRLEVRMNDSFGYLPFREENAAQLYTTFRQLLAPLYPNYEVLITALGQPIEQLIPNLYRTKTPRDGARMPVSTQRGNPIVQNMSKPFLPAPNGLFNRNIAVWHSHGWYYEDKLKRWEFQRARSFQTIEDLLPLQFVVPYLAPMLENAGANVFLPRERDTQINEVIVDNAAANSKWQMGVGKGFAVGTLPYSGRENPFLQGNYLQIRTDVNGASAYNWNAQIAETGDYSVYIAYKSLPESANDAHYTVYHAGGKTEFVVNQQIGGGTWIYLGNFKFNKGQNTISLSSQSATPNKIVTADAVRLGGGMGVVARNGLTSGRPKFVEGARYWMQAAGMPDSLVYAVSRDTEYKDDYQGRGEWVNYLKGAPFGPNRNRATKGLGIPIDLSLAWHTDAGLTTNGSTIGTLLIYNSKDAKGVRQFPDGQSRFASRDFSDLLQTQITEDLRKLYDTKWSRRQIWDKDYSEAFRPNVPAALLELLSHQNFTDMKFALDPQYRFDTSRAVYKAMLRFLADQYGFEPIVTPLAPDHLSAELKDQGAELRWKPVEDALESSAKAEQYVVYSRMGEGGWDNGTLVNQPSYRLNSLADGVVYTFKVVALNKGGVSFPSEVLAVGRAKNAKTTALVVNGFDRISSPAILETDSLSGFWNKWDAGVPDNYDIGFVGEQYEFRKRENWRDDDAPGHGASYADYEGKVIAGNTHDFAATHGSAFLANGVSFASASDEALWDGDVTSANYPIMDLILGEEKETMSQKGVMPPRFKAIPTVLQSALKVYLEHGGKLFASGSYIGTDLVAGKPDLNPDVQFAKNTLKMLWRTDHAAKTGNVYAVESNFMPFNTTFAFNTQLRRDLYAAEAPDGIEPIDANGKTLLRYGENNISAAIGVKDKLVLLGFPFEVVTTDADRTRLVQAVLKWLGQ